MIEVGYKVTYLSRSNKEYEATVMEIPVNPWHQWTSLPTIRLEFRDQRGKLVRKSRVCPADPEGWNETMVYYDVRHPSYKKADCCRGMDCPTLGMDEDEPCWGQTLFREEFCTDDDTYQVHACEGHEECHAGKPYQPPPVGVMRLNPLKTTQEKIEMLEYQISRNPEVMIQGTGKPVEAHLLLEILRKLRALELADEPPLTPEQAEKEFAEAPEVPLTKDEIEDIVEKVTDPEWNEDRFKAKRAVEKFYREDEEPEP